MAFQYTRSEFKNRLNALVQGRIGMLVDQNETVNQIARTVISDVDLRSLRRKATLTPRLFDEVYEFAAPDDLDGYKIIDIPPQAKRNGEEWFFIPTEEFDRQKSWLDGGFSIDDQDGTRLLLLALQIDDDTVVISDLDSLSSGGGTWEAFTGAENVTADSSNYIKGSGSINFDINSSAEATAGIKNEDVNDVDITDYLDGDGAVFVWAYLTNNTNVTSFTLRLGQSDTAYYSKTATTKHDGTAFVTGWNLVRFDLSSLSETGAPTATGIDYVAVYMDKSTSKVSETDYRFDYLVLKKGKIYEIKYYSKYPWNSSVGAWKLESTSDDDVLVADHDEYELMLQKGRAMIYEEINEHELATNADARYEIMAQKYRLRNPSEAQVMTDEYHSYRSAGGYLYGSTDEDSTYYGY